ncbi:MAG: glycoside hydrolase family 2, partial [Oscillospiraceae bacterium]|nr:glycoside hydrolase family 2 [Oscillospiraceae bacterium]
YLTADIPEGVWRIHVNFVTTAFNYKPEYINYIEADSVRVLIDEVYEKHYARYADLFGTVISGFFSDEPGFYNQENYGYDNSIGQRMPLPWGKELEETLLESYGKNLYRDLPLLFADHDDKSHRGLRVAYMNAVTTLYGKNFTAQLGDWCRAHGVEYIGHVVEDYYGYMRLGAGVGHYFRAMEGQHMAGIDNIGYQLMPCNDVASRHTGFSDIEPTFYHYYLGKLGASAAAIDPKKRGRLMCENFGAYGWRLGVRDMKWLADYWISQGVNYFVPHAFSMAEYPDNDCPPHFYARGSNPQFPWFCDLMRYIDRLCSLFSDGQNVPQAGLLFEAESDWSGAAMKGCLIGKELLGHQLDFMVLPADVLAKGAAVEGSALVVNGRRMDALIVPACEFIPAEAARFIAAHPDLPVLFVDRFPEGIAEMPEGGEALLKAALAGRGTVALDRLSETLRGMGVSDSLMVEGATSALHVYHYRKGERDIFMLMNVSSAETLDLTLHLPEAESYGLCDAMTDCTYVLDAPDGVCSLTIAPYQSSVVVTNPESTVPAKANASKLCGSIRLETFDLVLRGLDGTTETIADLALQPVSNFCRDFSGAMVYTAKFDLEKVPARAEFAAQYVFECMELTVNGKALPRVFVPPYAQDITEALREGENEITVRVVSTALRDANTRPGIFGKERTVLEPTGMFGKVEIRLFS